jgi:anti-sigma factor RsiW
MSTSEYICETENIAAYIEGDLEPCLHSALELHLKECGRCAGELQSQRLFMRELDFALASPFDLAVPPNFAEVVAVHAESDMRGARDTREHARALRYCVILGLAAFALLGFASSKSVILNVRVFATRVFGMLGFLTEAIFNAAAGFILIARVVSRGLLADSRGAALAGLLLLVLAIAVLSRLIARYHRTRLIE